MSSLISSAPLTKVASVRELLSNQNAAAQLASVAAKHMNPERMLRVVANAIRTTPKLQQCDPLSFLGALMHCASMGLEPNTPLGHAYLVPFENKRKGITEVQVILGYKGYADLARRSGQIISLHADVVYDDDELWSYEYGSNMHLRHKPGPRAGKKTHAYCHVMLKDGQAFIVLPWAQIMKTRDASQGWRTAVKFGKTAESPWGLYEDRMAAKTAVRAIANAGEIPLSIEFFEQTDRDDQAVDYKAFALNPTVGLNEIDGDIVDDEAQTEKRPAQVESKPSATVDGRAARQAEQVERRAAPAAEGKAALAAAREKLAAAKDEQEPAASAPARTASKTWHEIADEILAFAKKEYGTAEPWAADEVYQLPRFDADIQALNIAVEDGEVDAVAAYERLKAGIESIQEGGVK